jgi:hypothetical protein
MLSIPARIESISVSWPPPIRAELRQYIGRFYRESKNTRLSLRTEQCQPYWFLLPTWLAERYNRKKANTISAGTLKDILWAQYCVFLSMRIKDDLFDGQGITSLLFFAADQFLAESCDIFLRILRNSKPFWNIYNGSIRQSVQGFWEVDAMERRRQANLRQLRAGHAAVASIFKIGAAAVCHKADRRREFTIVGAAMDEMAIAGQILDDFQDMNEDLERGKFNYAVRYMLGSSARAVMDPTKAADLIADRLMRPDHDFQLFDEIIGYVQEAQRILRPLRLADSDRYFSEYIQSLMGIKDALKCEQMRLILRPGVRLR